MTKSTCLFFEIMTKSETCITKEGYVCVNGLTMSNIAIPKTSNLKNNILKETYSN